MGGCSVPECRKRGTFKVTCQDGRTINLCRDHCLGKITGEGEQILRIANLLESPPAEATATTMFLTGRSADDYAAWAAGAARHALQQKWNLAKARRYLSPGAYAVYLELRRGKRPLIGLSF